MPQPTIQVNEISENALQATLSQIRGLVSSRVVLNEHRMPSEVHVVASSVRNPKRIIRDVETLLLVKHNVRLDYRKISLVQLTESQLAQGASLRLIIQKIIEEDLEQVKRIRVEIQGLGRTLVGAAEVGQDGSMAWRAAARATIQSLKPMFKHQADVQLAEAEILPIGAEQIMIVILKCFVENREERWVGSCFVSPRIVESAARATLDALNRRLYALIY